MASDLTPSLQDLTDNIQESLNKYKNAEGSDAKAAALASIQEASGKLNDITKPVFQAMLEFQMRPYVNVATRTAIEMNIFTTLPQDGSSVNLSTLTKGAPNASEEFTLRIARVLGAFNVIAQTHDSATKEPFYAHTPLSRWISSVPGAAVTKHLFSDQVAPAVASVPNYFLKYGFASPASSKNCLYSYAHGRDDASFFDIIEKEKPEEFANFNVAMTVGPTLGLEEVIGAYDFGKLVGNKEGIVLVDVGGGQGHVLNEILKLNRELEGKVVLQDLAKVVEGGKVLDDKVLAGVQAYDFFEGVQPVKEANYFFKAIFHDWSDEACQLILRNMKEAMEKHSRLLICDRVFYDERADTISLLQDMNMMVIGGKERSLKQWEQLLGSEGYSVLKVWGNDHAQAQILEAVYDGALK